MLPDLDSDYGVPLRETMAFTAATLPMLLVGRFQSLALSYDSMVLVAVGMYLFVRFGVTNAIRRNTVHRGMFHSIPAGLIFAGMTFLLCGANDFPVRLFKAGGVIGGFMSHLILDEIYAVEWKRGRWHFKKSFGTAVKLWGEDPMANFAAYAQLLLVAMLVLGEPSVMRRLEARNPEFAHTYQEWRQRLNGVGGVPAAAQGALDAARADVDQFFGAGPQPGGVGTPPASVSSPGTYPYMPAEPPTLRSGLDTAQRPRGGIE